MIFNKQRAPHRVALVTNGVECMFTCLFAISILRLVNCLFRSFRNSVVWLVLIHNSSLYVLLYIKSFIRDILQIFFLWL